MSDFKFRCPCCEQSLAVPPDLMGHAIECPSCTERIQLPAHEEPLTTADRVETQDGGWMVRITAGPFEMGDGQDDDCPPHRVDLSEYWIGIHCVTNRQYARFVRVTGHRAPDLADSGEAVWRNGSCPEELLDHPVVCVSWDDAAAYADWAGLSLPSEAQWEKAARGPGGSIFPWGNDWEPEKCRNALNKGSGTTTAVNDFPHGASGFGTLQQAGNVWEWCADWYDENSYGMAPAKDPTGPSSGEIRVGRGGCWFCGAAEASAFRGAFRNANVPGARSTILGFRLVSNRSL